MGMTKNDVSKKFKSPDDGKSFEMGDAILRLCRGKYATSVCNSMRAFTFFCLHEKNTDALGRSLRARCERQPVIWKRKNGCVCKSVFVCSETVLLSIVPKERHVLFEKACQRRGNGSKVLYKGSIVFCKSQEGTNILHIFGSREVFYSSDFRINCVNAISIKMSKELDARFEEFSFGELDFKTR